jgi:NitT/TauT family transport system substrate-binding protein
LGLWAKNHLQEAADVAAQNWNQDPKLIYYALNTPEGRIVFDQFTPKDDELQYFGELMQRFGLTASSDIEGLIFDRFAREASLAGVTSLDTIVP